MDLSTMVTERASSGLYVNQTKLAAHLQANKAVAYANLNGVVYMVDSKGEATQVKDCGNTKAGLEMSRALAAKHNCWSLGFKGLARIQAAIKEGNLADACFVINHQAVYTNSAKKRRA